METVSYTHLDVYKRQLYMCVCVCARARVCACLSVCLCDYMRNLCLDSFLQIMHYYLNSNRQTIKQVKSFKDFGMVIVENVRIGKEADEMVKRKE